MKRQFFYIYICFFSTIIYAWHILRFWKWNRRHIGILLTVSILTMYPQLHVILLRPTKFHPNCTLWLSYDIISISKMAAASSEIYFPFLVWWRLALEKVKDFYVPNFAKISQSTAEILLPLLYRNKRPTSWKSTPLSILAVSPLSACGSALTYQISSEWDDRRRIYDVISIFKMAASASETYVRFLFDDVSHLRRSKTICLPNFAKISQSTAEILLLPFYRNKRLPSWKSTSTFHSDQFTIIGMWFCVGLPNLT